ncbi:hypothetical protein MLD38_025963 [Melastoma candidum]|uniref:Uncharacterized protein n=1 Tax=Melastoma candidum TaxID=119954 RepID=A0ACB9NY11_9MYRT|nr:hypothetical protein MLD38_025963 [Melastoma candidum]
MASALSSSSSLLPPHSALRFTDILRNDTRRFRIPKSLLALSPSACCGARFRPTLLNHRGLPPFHDGLGQRVQMRTWWISTVSSAVLMIAKGTAVQKSFLVPLLPLQAPSNVRCKGEYGAWAAFLALLIRLVFNIPAETQEGAILFVLMAEYPAYQHCIG